MKLRNVINPISVYKKRQWIIPELRRITHQTRANLGIPADLNELRIRLLHNKLRGRRAFIIGNGPSLRIEDLDRLKGEITFAANKIFLAFDQTDWRPTYYGAEDVLMFQKPETWATIQSLPSIKLFPSFVDQYVPRTPGALYYQHAFEDRYPAHPPFSTDPNRCVYGGNTVLYIMFQFAYYLGIRTVYVLGVDSNYTTPAEIVQKTSEGTFDLYRVENERNHFHPDYLRPGEVMYNPNVHRHLKSFGAAKEAFEADGRQVFNATRGGSLEVFERVDFDSLF